MEYEIYVPLLSWLLGGVKQDPKFGQFNYYTASFGSDPTLGSIGRKIFNYRVWLEKIGEEDKVMKAAVYYGTKCFEAQDEDEIQIRSFDYVEESKPLIKAWIEEEVKKFFED